MSDRENSVISSVLSNLGWDENLAIPIANEENKKLIAMIDLTMRQNAEMSTKNENLQDKITAMTNHLKNCKQELKFTETLVIANEQEIQTESHIAMVAEREQGRLAQEVKRLAAQLEEVAKRKNTYENSIFKQTSELDEIRSKIKWDQRALEAWLEESEKKGEDFLALQKYARKDDTKINELNLQLEKLTKESNLKRQALDNEVIDTQTTQVELEKTSEEFRNAHQERQQLIGQWENTIDQMKRRDADINELTETLNRTKAEVRENEDALREKARFLQSQVENNAEMNKKIGLADRTLAKIRLELKEAEKNFGDFQSELEALKRTCDRTASDLEAARSSVTHLKKERAEKERKNEQIQQKCTELAERLERVTSDKMTAEERTAEADRIMEEEETLQHSLEQELKKVRELEFKRNQQLQDQLTEKRNIEAYIMSSKAALKNLNSKVGKLDQAILKQQEILYNQDFEIQQMERRVNRMQGNHSNEEKMALEARIKEMTDDLNEKNKTLKILQTQLKHVQDDIRRVKRDTDKVEEENQHLQSKIEELNLHNETSLKELRRVQSEKENLTVEENIIRLEIKRQKEILYSKADEVMSLEKQRLQLDTAIKERRQEIQIHKDMLMTQLRTAETEKSQVNCELQARIAKIDKLEKRYEILMVSMAPPEGEEEQSQAYYVIKAAQEKESLQRLGDELDAKIRKAEKEIRALENSLLLMNSCNNQYRKSVSRVTDNSEAMQTKAELETQLQTITDKVKFRRRQHRETEEQLQTLRETLEMLQKDGQLYSEQTGGLQEKLYQREAESRLQQEKIDRAQRQIARLKREIEQQRGRSGAGATDDEKWAQQQEDIGLREEKQFNRRIAMEIERAVQTKCPTAINQTRYLMESSGMVFGPAGPGSVRGGGPGSSGDSASARTSLTMSSQRSSARSVGSGSRHSNSLPVGVQAVPPPPNVAGLATPTAQSPAESVAGREGGKEVAEADVRSQHSRASSHGVQGVKGASAATEQRRQSGASSSASTKAKPPPSQHASGSSSRRSSKQQQEQQQEPELLVTGSRRSSRASIDRQSVSRDFKLVSPKESRSGSKTDLQIVATSISDAQAADQARSASRESSARSQRSAASSKRSNK